MDKAKAELLLDRLRTRTEKRGATAAEAAQAAELAEKIAKRYGMDVDGQPEKSFRCQMQEKRFPYWAHLLAYAIAERFGIRGDYTNCPGQPTQVRFTGPGHLANVAAWLFNAICNDLSKRSYVAARANGMSGPGLVRFRNRFRAAAACELSSRLNPRPYVAYPEDLEKAVKKMEARRSQSKALTPSQARSLIRDRNAASLGRSAGQEISIDTNVLPEEKNPKQPLFLCDQHRSSNQIAK